jgi:hypothetical protein
MRGVHYQAGSAKYAFLDSLLLPEPNWLRGEYTPFMIIGYFGLTTFLTAFAFGSYLILTKLKII